MTGREIGSIPPVPAQVAEGEMGPRAFENLPNSIFLDTNVVHCLVKWGAEIFDCVSLREGVHPALARAIEAFRGIFMVCKRADFSLPVSHKTMDEIHDTPDEKLRENLVAFGAEFLRRLTLANLDPVGTSTFPLCRPGLTKGQRKALVRTAVAGIVNLAKLLELPLVMERPGFAANRSGLV